MSARTAYRLVVCVTAVLLLVVQDLSAQGYWTLIGHLSTRRGLHTATVLPDGRVLYAGGEDRFNSLDSFELFDPATRRTTKPAETMNEGRTAHTATLLADGRVLVVGGEGATGAIDSSELFDPVTGLWASSPTTIDQARWSHTATMLADGRVLIVGGSDGTSSVNSFEIFDPGSDTWSVPTATLTVARFGHTATLLPDGRVLIVGGDGGSGPLDSFEIFDPFTGTATKPAPVLTDARFGHTATLLADGRVVVVGGKYLASGALDTFEIFNPATGLWTLPAETLNEARHRHSAALLPDGRVLIAAGRGIGNWVLDTYELFDPVAGSWTMPADTLNELRLDHATVLLPDGRVLVAAGASDDSNEYINSVEIFEPGTGSVDPTAATLVEARNWFTTTLLPDGRVLAAAGNHGGVALNNFELFDPSTDTWTMPAQTLGQARISHTATLLPDGRVIVIGGGGYVASVESFDFGTEMWTTLPQGLTYGRSSHTATQLADGRVLVVGGFVSGPAESVEIFDPSSGNWTLAQDAVGGRRSQHTATLLHDGRVVVAGGNDGTGWTGPLRTFEVFDPETDTWTATSETLNDPRYAHTATLLLDGKVLLAGGYGMGYDVLNTFEIFDPETNTWSMPARTMNEGRINHTATLLDDGRVLVAGGNGSSGWLDSFDIYDPDTGEWILLTATMNQARTQHAMTLLADGRVLVAAGWGWDGASTQLATFEILTLAEVSDSRRPVVNSILSDAPVAAAYDPGLAAPRCASSVPICDSGMLLDGRDGIGGGAEPNQPNTIDGCPDGGSGVYHQSESIDRIRVHSFDGSRLRFGLLVTVEVTIWAASANDRLDLFAIPDATVPFFQYIGTLAPDPARVPGLQTLSTTYSLAGVPVQGVRANLRFMGGVSTCSAGITDDHDDLIFAVDSGPSPIVDAIKNGQTATVTGNGFGGDSEAGDGTTNGSPTNYPLIRLRSMESDRIFWTTPDPRQNFSDDPMNLDFNQLPPGLDIGMYALTVVASGVPSVARLVEIDCGTLSTSSPVDVSVDLGQSANFVVSTVGARSFQWQRCVTQDCLPGDWLDIVGAVSPTYTTDPADPSDSGSRFRVEVRGACGLNPTPCSQLAYGCVQSGFATLTVNDGNPPVVDVLSPDGGEYWLLSDPGEDGVPDTGDDPPPNTELVSWSMSDDVRICTVTVQLEHSDNGGSAWTPTPGGTLLDLDLGTPCVHPGVEVTAAPYTVPTDPPSGTAGSLYRIVVSATDHNANTEVDSSANPFYIVQPNLESIRTLVLARFDRQTEIFGPSATAMVTKLYELADHPRVQGVVVDLDTTTVGSRLDDWDAGGASSTDVLFGAGGLHEYLREELLPTYSGTEFVVLVGDDRMIPFARLDDGGMLYTESDYPAGGDIGTTSTVGASLAGDLYLSDDPLAVLDPIAPADLVDGVFIPDLAIGRLVETPAEITTTIATFISQDGFLDLVNHDPVDDHRVLVTGYDFLIDSGRKIRERWKSRLGLSTGDLSVAPVNGVLLSSDWGRATVDTRVNRLERFLDGLDGMHYGIASLNGHASHFEEGVPGADAHDIQGLSAQRIDGLDFSGSVIYAVGCHGGLVVPGSDPGGADHSLDLAQVFLGRGVVAYLANTGYGWGLRHGVGYSERLMEIFTEELTKGGAVGVGDAVRDAKRRYVLEAPTLDDYDAKSLMQWTLYGLPMYTVSTGIAAGKSVESLSKAAAGLGSGPVTVSEVASSAKKSLPSHLTRLDLQFDLSAPGVYSKYDADGGVVTIPGCAHPDGCYYTLNGLVERSTGGSDVPLQPMLLYDSRLAGTSQHGVLWKGGSYHEEDGWKPVIGELVSNGGDGSNHGSTPRKAIIRPKGTRVIGGEDPDNCRPSDLELNGLVLAAGEAVKASAADLDYTMERLYQDIGLEVFYYNDTAAPFNNCDRTGPLLGAGPFGGAYHLLDGETVSWEVPASDDAGVWRVVVVATDNTVDGGGVGRWSPIELEDLDGDGRWTGSLDMTGVARLTYVLQAMDDRGNVTWLDFVSAEPPSSGIDPGLPLPVDVENAEIFSDDFESGDTSKWSASTD